MSHKEILIYEWAMKKCEFWTEINFYFIFQFQINVHAVWCAAREQEPGHYTTVPVDTILQACKSQLSGEFAPVGEEPNNFPTSVIIFPSFMGVSLGPTPRALLTGQAGQLAAAAGVFIAAKTSHDTSLVQKA